jgi:hypothetical protein
MKELEELQRKLRIAEANVENEMIQKDAVLKKSAQKKIAELKSQIANYFVKGKKEEPKKEEKVAKVPAPKKEVVKKEKVEKPKKEKAEKKQIGAGGFVVGDKVSFIKKSTGETINGDIKRIYEYKDSPGKFIAVVVDKNGKTHQPTISASLKKA